MVPKFIWGKIEKQVCRLCEIPLGYNNFNFGSWSENIEVLLVETHYLLMQYMSDVHNINTSSSFLMSWVLFSHQVLSDSLATPRTVAHQAPLSMRSQEEYWSRLPFPFPGSLPHPGIELMLPALHTDFFLPFFFLALSHLQNPCISNKSVFWSNNIWEMLEGHNFYSVWCLSIW